MRTLRLLALLALEFAVSALAVFTMAPAQPASAAGSTVTVTIMPQLSVAFSPALPAIACNAAPGTVVAGMSAVGGDGNPVTIAVTGGDTTDFTLSGSNIVVGPSGIAGYNCGHNEIFTVTPSQSATLP